MAWGKFGFGGLVSLLAAFEAGDVLLSFCSLGVASQEMWGPA